MDWAIDGFPEATEAAPPERELVPEGDHEFTIREISEDDKRLTVVLVHDDKRYGWVYAGFPRGHDWAKRIVHGLVEALGFTPEGWAAAKADQIKDRRVGAYVYHRPGNTGKTFVNVRTFSKPAQAPAKRAPARTPAAKVTASLGSDDIPF
jgi:hypothetical protein